MHMPAADYAEITASRCRYVVRSTGNPRGGRACKTGPALRDLLVGARVPIAVADYQGVPADPRGALPSAAELEVVLEDELGHRAEGLRNPF